MSKPDENLRLVAIRDEDTGRVFQEFMDSDIVNLMVTFGGMEENEIGEADADGDDDCVLVPLLDSNTGSVLDIAKICESEWGGSAITDILTMFED